jgi:hypothetical protein
MFFLILLRCDGALYHHNIYHTSSYLFIFFFLSDTRKKHLVGKKAEWPDQVRNVANDSCNRNIAILLDIPFLCFFLNFISLRWRLVSP